MAKRPNVFRWVYVSNGILYIQSTPDFKYFKCSAWLRVPETSEFAQDIVVPDWEDVSGTKRAWEKAVQKWRKDLQLLRRQERESLKLLFERLRAGWFSAKPDTRIACMANLVETKWSTGDSRRLGLFSCCL